MTPLTKEVLPPREVDDADYKSQEQLNNELAATMLIVKHWLFVAGMLVCGFEIFRIVMMVR